MNIRVIGDIWSSNECYENLQVLCDTIDKNDVKKWLMDDINLIDELKVIRKWQPFSRKIGGN